MDGERGLVASPRILSLVEKFHDKRYRDGYVAAHTRGVLARQMRNFRGERSQADFAAKIGKQKTVVARLENPAYGAWSLRTMLELAREENVAVLVRFVDFPTFLGFTNDMSDESLHPRAYDEREVNQLIKNQSSSSGAIIDIGAFSPESKWTLITLKRSPDKPIIIHTEPGEPLTTNVTPSNDFMRSYEILRNGDNPIVSRIA
jgi:hypothetical protein